MKHFGRMRQVKDLLLELGRRGKTILLSSHLLADVEDVCDRMVVLYGGKIRASGTADQLLEDSDHTVIETQRLRPETIVRIEKVLQESEGVGIQNTHAPRQKLEDLFMKIVEQAKSEQIANSGALHGGKTAKFLAETGLENQDLLKSLVEDHAPTPTKVARPAKANENKAASDVLTDLAKEQEHVVEKPRPVSAPKPVTGVDRGMLDDLMGNDPKSGGSASS